MNREIFYGNDLPLKDLAAVGLMRGDRVNLDPADLKALLSGRRTNLLRLNDLEHAGMKIAALNVKLSLVSGSDGKPELRLHPIYVRSIPPTYLNDNEIEALETGEDQMLEKDIVDTNGQRKRVLVEFDPETKQFLETDEEKLQVPVEVNGQALTPEQKARYKRGQEVEMPDGTKFRYTATNREGLRANRIELIASLLLDGGISYLLFQGLRTLTGHHPDHQNAPHTDAYLNTLAKMQTQEMEEQGVSLEQAGNQETRRYTRTSAR